MTKTKKWENRQRMRAYDKLADCIQILWDLDREGYSTRHLIDRIENIKSDEGFDFDY